ncbi:uncharacterized protein LOC127080389 [Lathyrus oleraceus]|uniref:uncharacterized protein LOC127080389 n=1 Tax=Pisum sativum TaxID=3888 RepID=UPI0021D0C7EF|nr:uncharacterized protein LOC127080389 [Pisum sativum]
MVFVLKIWRHYLYGSRFEVFSNHKSLKYLFNQKELNMRQRRWLEFLKDYDFGLNHHSGKANVVVDALNQKSLHMSALMIRELDLIEQFRYLSMVCELITGSVMLDMLKVNSVFLNEIRENQKLDVKLVDLLSSMNPNEESDFKMDAHGVLRFRGRVCVLNNSELKRMILSKDIEAV